MFPLQESSRQKVLVTGAGGFVGRVLCEALLAEGRQLVALDASIIDRQTSNLRDLAALAASGQLTIRQHDLAGDGVDLSRVLSEVDAVVHLAGSPGVQTSWARGFDHHVANNVVATQRLLEAALDAPVERIVVASSSSVYGNVSDGAATEDRALHPLSPYGAAKAAMEHVVGAYVERGLPVTPLRFFTVYGPHQRPDMAMYRMIEAAMGGPRFTVRGSGAQVRNFTFVDDAVGAIVAAIDLDPPSGRPFNIGGPSTHSVQEVLDCIADVFGSDVPIETVASLPGDPERTAADNTRAVAELGWRPQVDLRTGLERQVAWQRQQAGRLTGAIPAASRRR